MNWKTLEQLDLNGKRVLTRVDINVPMNGDMVSDSTRIERIVPTIKKIINAKGIPILISHFGRPNGIKDEKYSLKKLIPCLSEHLDQSILFTDVDEIKMIVRQSRALKAGDILLLENIRFRSGETSNDPILAKQLAEIGDIYCNDAFSAAHRAHASTEGVAHLLPNCVGCLMETELSNLEKVLSKPRRPLTAVIGGSKVSTKIDLLLNLVKKVDVLVIGGGMANTFLKARDMNIGKSICEISQLDIVEKITNLAIKENCKIILPTDIIVATELKNKTNTKLFDVKECPEKYMILDIGPQTVKEIKQAIKNSKTLIWNGPMGAFEFEPFNEATDQIAKFVSELTIKGDLISVAGGGDTISALSSTKSDKKFSYISTAGGAFLEWVEGKKLPAIEALRH